MPSPAHAAFGSVEPIDADRTTADSSPLHDATSLTAGGRVARIHLNGQFYALRITRAGKLILTK
jgi:hemin uptake protein HemP